MGHLIISDNICGFWASMDQHISTDHHDVLDQTDVVTTTDHVGVLFWSQLGGGTLPRRVFVQGGHFASRGILPLQQRQPFLWVSCVRNMLRELKMFEMNENDTSRSPREWVIPLMSTVSPITLKIMEFRLSRLFFCRKRILLQSMGSQSQRQQLLCMKMCMYSQ